MAQPQHASTAEIQAGLERNNELLLRLADYASKGPAASGVTQQQAQAMTEEVQKRLVSLAGQADTKPPKSEFYQLTDLAEAAAAAAKQQPQQPQQPPPQQQPQQQAEEQAMRQEQAAG